MRNVFLAVATAFTLALPATAKSSTAEVHCSDGTTGKAGRGACSHHGGVGKAAALPSAKTSIEPSTGAPTAQQRTRAESKPSQSGNAAPQNNGGVLSGIFGRRNTSDTPRTSSREAPAGKVPMATCKDGTTSYSAHHSGTCSGHGGVQQWLDK